MRKVTREVCRAFAQREKRTIANSNTDGTTLFLHGNAIAQWRDDGLYITNAGWPTTTTKERLNGLGGVSICQTKGIWYLNGYKWDGTWVRVDGFAGNIDVANEKKDRAMLKKIKAYSNLYLNKDIYPLIPGGGDCWYCALTTTVNKETLGDATKNHEHLHTHIDDKYVQGSVIVNALRESGYRDYQIGFHLHGFAPDNVQRAVYKYLKKRLTNLAN